jgi:hypothetical protein
MRGAHGSDPPDFLVQEIGCQSPMRFDTPPPGVLHSFASAEGGILFVDATVVRALRQRVVDELAEMLAASAFGRPGRGLGCLPELFPWHLPPQQEVPHDR